MTRCRGAALLLVILLIALLAVMVVEFQREARLELRAAGNLRDMLQTHALARSGVAVGAVLLLEDLENSETSKYDGRDEDWNLQNFPVPLGAGAMNAVVERVEDLDGKFPLGALIDQNGVPQARAIEAYRRFLGALGQHLKASEVTILDQVAHENLVEALTDWIDADSDGAYESNGNFTVPNTPLLHLDDLQRIEGYGEIPEGFQRSIADAILPFVDTRQGLEVNINTASPPVLAAMHPDLSYEDAVRWYDQISEAPETGNFNPQNYSSLRDLNQTQFVLQAKITSDRFRVRLGVDVGGVYQKAEAVLERDRKAKTVSTVEWREGWLRDLWRPADPPLGEVGLPFVPEGVLQ